MINSPQYIHLTRKAFKISTGVRFVTSGMASPTPKFNINSLPRSLYPASISYSQLDFRRQDEGLDTHWYSQPRLVQHIDNNAISSLKSYYSSIMKPGDSILDICSSWVSHLPESFKPRFMTGYGMNKYELERNKHLTQFFIRDLNVSPSLDEMQEESVDVVICNVSVDYLVKPVKVFEEMRRVLKNGGTAHIAFSNRCFPTKVIGKWMKMNDEERRKWVGGYFWASGGWSDVEEVILTEKQGDFWGAHVDPLYVVRARKAEKRAE